MKCFEIFITEDKITVKDWLGFLDKVTHYDRNISIEVVFQLNTVEFYLYTQRDLSSLVAKLEKFVLKPIDRRVPSKEKISSYRKIGFRLSARKNILEIKEAEEIRKQRVLKRVVINLRQILTVKMYSITAIFNDLGEGELVSHYTSFTNPMNIFEFDFKDNIKVQKRSVPIFLKIDGVANLFTPEAQRSFLEIFGFPNFSYPVYFPLQGFEFSKHSLIVGQTGVGKSKLIELFIKNVAKHSQTDEYAIVIIDPHASLYPQFLNLEQNKVNFDFIHSSCALFPAFSEPKIATELTILLFKTLLRDQFNAKMERVLKYALYVLFLKNKMSLLALKRFLTELEFRKEILEGSDEQFDYLTHFFETEFVELQTKFYEVSTMPILVLIDELSFIPAFSSNAVNNNLEPALKDNFLTCFSLNRIFLGEKATRLIAGLIIQQLFLLAQKGSLNKKIIMIIDEVSTVENESLISILSEARKFNLSLFLSQQYLTQITPDLLRGILSNVYNYFVFKISDEDAKILVKNMDLNFPDDVLTKQKEKGFSDEDLKRNLLTTLNPRECVVRIFADGKFYPCFKGKTMDMMSR